MLHNVFLIDQGHYNSWLIRSTLFGPSTRSGCLIGRRRDRSGDASARYSSSSSSIS